eukprot:2624055-Rhodomonas_salina.3
MDGAALVAANDVLTVETCIRLWMWHRQPESAVLVSGEDVFTGLRTTCCFKTDARAEPEHTLPACACTVHTLFTLTVFAHRQSEHSVCSAHTASVNTMYRVGCVLSETCNHLRALDLTPRNPIQETAFAGQRELAMRFLVFELAVHKHSCTSKPVSSAPGTVMFRNKPPHPCGTIHYRGGGLFRNITVCNHRGCHAHSQHARSAKSNTRNQTETKSWFLVV